MEPTHPYWLTLATTRTLVQAGVSVPDALSGKLVALFDRHHRDLGMREPLVSGWGFRPVGAPRRSATQVCEDTPFACWLEKHAQLWELAAALDEASLVDGNPEAWQLAYVRRDRRTTCATPYSACLPASRADMLKVHQFFRVFTAACMEALNEQDDTHTCYGWAIVRQMEDPFLPPAGLVPELHRQLAPLLRSANKPVPEGGWSRLDALEADIQALLLEATTTTPASPTALHRL